MVSAVHTWIKASAGPLLLRALVVLLASFATHAVHAAEPSPTVADVPFAQAPAVPEAWDVTPTLAVRAEPEQRWYGWQPLLVDTAGQLFVAWSMSFARQYQLDEGSCMVASLATYALVPPLIHAKRGHWGKAGLDLLLRVSLPVVGGLPAVWDEGRSHTLFAMAAINFVAGMGAAIIIDATALSKEPMPAPDSMPPHQRPDAGWSPDRATNGTGVRF